MSVIIIDNGIIYDSVLHCIKDEDQSRSSYIDIHPVLRMRISPEAVTILNSPCGVDI